MSTVVVNRHLADAEGLFLRMRAGRNAAAQQLPPTADATGERPACLAGVHVFPTAVVTTRAWPADVSCEPGGFPLGVTAVDYVVRVGTDAGDRDDWRIEVRGTFSVVVSDDPQVAVPPPVWAARSRAGAPVPIDSLGWADQLPTSVFVPAQSGARRDRALRRLVTDGDAARGQLAVGQRPLAANVVNRLRGELGSERGCLSVDELEHVAISRIVDVADRWFAGRAADRPSTAGWSKVAVREATGAVRREIAAATGVSVEFRQLLLWMRDHPADRDRPAADVARAMAVSSGVSRLVQARLAPDRRRAAALLDAMLADGRATYADPALTAVERRARRESGAFVVAARSSLAEIVRAQRHCGGAAVAIDAPDTNGAATTIGDRLLVDERDPFGDVDNRRFLATAMTERSVSTLEASVWCARTGVLGGGSCELAEIAHTLGLAGGRAEARSALRRAWRKLDDLAEVLAASAA